MPERPFSSDPGTTRSPETGRTGAVGAEVAEVRALVEATAADGVCGGVLAVRWRCPGRDPPESKGEPRPDHGCGRGRRHRRDPTRGERPKGPVPLAVGGLGPPTPRRYRTGDVCEAGAASAAHHQAGHLHRLAECVLTGAAPIAAASVAAAEMLRLLPDLQPDSCPPAGDAYADPAAAGDPSEVRRLRPRDRALRETGRAGQEREVGRSREPLPRLRRRRVADRPPDEPRPQSPQPSSNPPRPRTTLSGSSAQTASPDTRSWSTRRANRALIELISRAVRADDPGGVVGRSSTRPFWSDPADLASGAGAGEHRHLRRRPSSLSIRPCGHSRAGQITPSSSILTATDPHWPHQRLHRAAGGRPDRPGRRLHFPRLQATELDRTPITLVHWIDGGTTDLGSAALLCRMHTWPVQQASPSSHGHPATPTRTPTRVLWVRRPEATTARARRLISRAHHGHA